MSRTKTSRTSANSPRHIHVVPAESGWQVSGSGRVSTLHASRDEAVEAARSALRRSGGELNIHGPHGRIRECLTLGRDMMGKIAAVEGITLSGHWESFLNDLDAAGASSEERRRAVALQFGKKR